MQYKAIILAPKKKKEFGCLNLGTLGIQYPLAVNGKETRFLWSKGDVTKVACIAVDEEIPF